jgi:hypothetical protein
VYFVDAIIRWKTGTITIGSLKLVLIIGCLMFIGVMINPGGASMLEYPLKTVQIKALQAYIQEWQSPNFHNLSVQPFAWLILTTLGVVGASRRRIAFSDFLLSAGFIYMGLMAGRNIALFALVAPLVITRHAEPLIGQLSNRFNLKLTSSASRNKLYQVLNWLIIIILGIVVLFKVSTIIPNSINQQEFKKILPVAAVEYLNIHQPPGRIFNSYNWGGYILFKLPDYPVFVDGRTDLYSDLIINEWINVIQAGDGWQAILDKWKINLILIEPAHPIVCHLEREGWRLLFQDEVAVLYQRPPE